METVSCKEGIKMGTQKGGRKYEVLHAFAYIWDPDIKTHICETKQSKSKGKLFGGGEEGD